MARLSESPTLELLLVFTGFFLIDAIASVIGLSAGVFALAAPLTDRPWTLATSVYAHASITHLIANAVALAIVGFPLERTTTRLRFHSFFLAAGALAGASQILIAGLLATPTSVIGASGAVFALFGYAITGNRLAGPLLDRLAPTRRTQFIIFASLAVGVTIITAAPGVALIAHFTGLLLGTIAGRLHLLRPA